MADFAGQQSATSMLISYGFGGNEGSEEAYTGVTGAPNFTDELGDNGQEAGVPEAGPGLADFLGDSEFAGLFSDVAYPDWFEKYHVLPRVVQLGNIFGTTSEDFVIHSAYRSRIGTWSGFTNNAGAGVTLSGAPAFPATMYPHEDYGATLIVTTSGPASVDSTLEFEFDGGSTVVVVPITLDRLVLFPVKPELPYQETLAFLTDIIRSDDGSEQRIALRKNPRQLFRWNVALDTGTFDQSRVNMLMFDWQGRVWGIPVWHEATLLSASASAGATTFNVDSTANADFRVGGLFLIYTDSGTFDVLEVSALTATTITSSSASANAYAANAEVVPLRTGVMESNVSSSRFRTLDQTIDVSFLVKDNDSDIGDTSAYDTYNSKVLLDGCNVALSDTVPENFQTALSILDNLTGQFYQTPVWARGKRGSSLTLSAHTKAELWQVRRLFHALRGRQVSFYLPTFAKDLLPDNDLTSGSPDLDIVNVGYVQFAQDRQPKDRLWIRLVDGTTYTRAVLSSAETSSSRETLTLDANWPSNISQSDIERISFLEEVRLDSDNVEVTHERGRQTVFFQVPVITTFE